MSEGVVLKLVPRVSRQSLNCDKLLQDAIDEGLQDVIIVGYAKSGELYAASSTADGGEIVYLLELLKHKLFSGDFYECPGSA
jgi:hypothetical protein